MEPESTVTWQLCRTLKGMLISLKFFFALTAALLTVVLLRWVLRPPPPPPLPPAAVRVAGATYNVKHTPDETSSSG